MNAPPPDPVESLLGELLRHPEPPRDIGVERALLRLTAARSDAPYLLLHRLLVLESALAQLRQAGVEPAASPRRDGAAPAAVPRPRRAATPARGFLRDAAVVAAGVLAGSALAQGAASVPVPGGADGPPDPGADAGAGTDPEAGADFGPDDLF